MTELNRRLFLRAAGTGIVVAGAAPVMPAFAAADDGPPAADDSAAVVTVVGDTVTLTNTVLKVSVKRAGGLTLTSLHNRAVNIEYQTLTAPLFTYELDGTATVTADDGGWTVGAMQQTPITMYTKQGNRVVGRQVRIPLTRTAPKPITVTAIFEIYDGRSGLRFYTLVRNNNTADTLTITNSVVLALGAADAPHTLHYVPNQTWKSTRAGLAPKPEDTSSAAKRAELPKKVVAHYDAGHGFSVTPEINWKTMRGHGQQADYMRPPFAGLDVWSGTDHVRVVTNPVSLQLVLFPNEEFEYLSVNVTVFAGTVVDGRMAEAEHLRRRFRYNNTSTVFHTNDWDYRGGPSRELPPDYYYTTIIPKAQAAGFDMVMLDDFWNVTRDSIEPSDQMKKSIHSLAEFTQTLTDKGLLFGLWFSLTGGGHGEGRDLADPVNLAFKRQQIETLITQFHMTHHMIDLTEYFQNEQVTTYSHPSDSVYRKATLVRRMMNELVQRYPHLLPKMTSELDIAPTQGDRNNELMHICHNGWNTANGAVTGEALSLRTALTGFGHLPMESAYMNIGAMSGKMEDFYSYLAVRAVKFPKDPGNEADWPPTAIALMAAFNRWRKSPRIRALTDQLFRPVFLGPGWDTSNWDSSVGPYVWMYVDEGRNTAMVVATGSGGQASGATVDLRWLNPAVPYLVSDITLDDKGTHTYAFRGVYAGAALKAFPIDLRANTSRGKAYWITRAIQPGLQVTYADENVTSWTARTAGGRTTVSVTGVANSTATLVVADPAANRGLVVTVALNAKGTGSAVVAPADLVPPQPVGSFFAEPVLIQAEKASPAGAPFAVISEGNASNGQWVRADFTAAGQKIEYALDVPADGQYQIEIRYKENASRGRSQAYLDGTALGPVVDHYYPGRVYQGLEFRTRVLGVRGVTAGKHVLAFESKGTSGSSLAVGVDYVKLTPTLSRDALVFETEAVTAGSSGTPSTVAEAAASGGAFQLIPATGPGAYVEYTVTAPRAGRYRLAALTKRTPARGQASIAIDGVALDRVIDFYLPSSAGDYQYLEEDFGFVTFAAAGSKTVRFTVTGKASGSTGFQIAVDRLTLTPVGQLTLGGPDTVAVGAQIQPVVTGVDIDVYTGAKYLLWSVDGADAGAAAWVDELGRVTGRAQGTAVVRVRSQIDPTVAASMTVTVS